MPGWNGQRQKHLPPNWQKLRRRVLARDNFTCLECGNPATDVDHAGASDDHRLVMLESKCRSCHARRSSRQGHEAKPKRKREPEKHPGIRVGRGT